MSDIDIEIRTVINDLVAAGIPITGEAVRGRLSGPAVGIATNQLVRQYYDEMQHELAAIEKLDPAGFTPDQAAIAQSVDPSVWNAEESAIMNPSPKYHPRNDEGPAIFV